MDERDDSEKLVELIKEKLGITTISRDEINGPPQISEENKIKLAEEMKKADAFRAVRKAAAGVRFS